ncbi:50S ribosomal protein L13e [Acidianus manzaensis]|uniref:Large ribosomal subunit protein eL13 n=1 Tax=Acidianus manzaensis TaxID=282676 RepID=A0A1W6JWU7_9CREN|nr:50S ribosomal protein L13e [Acidianus manzaensis]ARM74766.1 50S ribosomal protein L13e [Acidianus manzaensis]
MDRPQAIIKRPTYYFEYSHERKQNRVGRGFSLGELKNAGITLQEAKKLGLRVDIRRKSIHQENVDSLKKYKESLGNQKVSLSKS